MTDETPKYLWSKRKVALLNKDKMPSYEDPNLPATTSDAGVPVEEVLPVVAWCELTQGGQIAYFDGRPMVMPGPVGNDCHPHALTPHAPAQATVVEQAAEIERLKGEKAELSYEFGAAMQRCSLTIDRLTRERDEASRQMGVACAEQLYLRAELDELKATGITHHVDHEIPLLGTFVSGLHVETNLRVLPARDNILKSNRFEVE